MPIMEVTRYDRGEIKATRTDEGYLIDTPIVGRIGIQVYKNADGSLRRELRPPEEVFNADSLATYAGKPITYGHPKQKVTSKNAKSLAVGMMRDSGIPDGDNVKVHLIVHDDNAIENVIKNGVSELSLGYSVKLDETPGVWNGQEYDAIQTNIKVNHLAIVPRGRAGNARLNLDRHDAVIFDPEEEIMSTDNLGRIRLDSGLEYQAAQEVVVEVEKLRSDKVEKEAKLVELVKRADALTAENDTLKSQVQSADKVRADALEAAKAELKARASLEKVAAEFKIDSEGKTDREIKEAVIKSLRKDEDLSAKSEDYLDAAFDITVALKSDVKMAGQRATVGARSDAAPKQNTYDSFMKSLGNKEAK